MILLYNCICHAQISKLKIYQMVEIIFTMLGEAMLTVNFRANIAPPVSFAILLLDYLRKNSE